MIKIQEYKETNYEIIGGYLSIIILLLFSSFTNTFVSGNITYNNVVLAAVLIAYLVRYRSIPLIYFKIILVFIAYNVIHYLIYLDVHPLFFIRYFFYISLAFFTIRFNFGNFFERLEKVIYYGALISLPLFAFQTLFFGQFYTAISSLQHLMGITSIARHDGAYYANTFFYTINTSGEARNCGFMFEPGAFGSILSIAVGLNLVHTNFNFRNKRFVVLLLALATTFSTTAFLAVVSLILFYIVNRKLKKAMLLIPAGAVVILILFQLPFMSHKINKLSSNPGKQFNTTIQMANNTDRLQSLGRFAGLMLNFKDFEKAPVFGLGGHDVLRESEIHHWNVSSVNGLGDYLSTFGIIGFLLLIFNLSRTFSGVTENYNIRGHYFLVIVVLIAAFSFILLPTPLFFAFQIFYLSRARIISESQLEMINNRLSYSYF